MLNRIARIHQSLSAAESRVAGWILEHPQRVVASTLAEVATAAAVSEPTVVRFCRSSGTRGFRDFKVRLAQHLAASDHVVHADVAADDNTDQIIAKVIGRSVQELIAVRDRLNPADVDAVVTMLLAAERFDFYGIGASGLVVADAQNKFFRLGVPCNAYTDSPTMLQAAAIARPGYVIIAVSKTGLSTTVVDAARGARRNGAAVAAITTPLSPLADAVETALLIDVDEDTGEFTPMSSRLAQLAVLDVLQVAYALRLGDAGLANLNRTKKALKRAR